MFINMVNALPARRIDRGRQCGLDHLRRLAGIHFAESRLRFIIRDERVRQVLEHHQALGGRGLGIVLALDHLAGTLVADALRFSEGADDVVDLAAADAGAARGHAADRLFLRQSKKNHEVDEGADALEHLGQALRLLDRSREPVEQILAAGLDLAGDHLDVTIESGTSLPFFR